MAEAHHDVGRNGKKVWHQSDRNVLACEMLEAREAGKAELFHSNASGQLVVRDASGEMWRIICGQNTYAIFALTRWGQRRKRSLVDTSGVPQTLTANMSHSSFWILMAARLRSWTHPWVAC